MFYTNYNLRKNESQDTFECSTYIDSTFEGALSYFCNSCCLPTENVVGHFGRDEAQESGARLAAQGGGATGGQGQTERRQLRSFQSSVTFCLLIYKTSA